MIKPTKQKIRDRIKEHGCNYKITQLCLDQISIDQFTPDLAKIIQRCSNIQYLTLQYCKLHSLQNLPSLQSLTALQLDNNKINGIGIQNLSIKYPYLKSLGLTNNKIEQISAIESLKNCKSLQKLNIYDNMFQQASFIQKRQNIFDMLPSLLILNGIDRSGNRIQDNSENQAYSESSQTSEQDSVSQEGQSPSKMRKI